MGANELRRARNTLADLEKNVAELAKVQRRLRRGIQTAIRSLDTLAEVLRVQARRAAAPASDCWPEDSAAFGQAVRLTRESAKLTRTKLAALVGVSDNTIANIEQGQRCRAEIRAWLVQTLAQLERGSQRHAIRS